ncbi:MULTISPECIES: hypothetical protein [unclassified Isoptericola]|uniref:hypothetical protein n=1 Tax=unclassified Isoptericola TaxID=2623355 RepID=UPI00365D25AF
MWYLRGLEIIGQGIRGLSVLELEDEIVKSPHGLQISWDELVGLLRDAEDVHDLIATGHRTPVALRVDAAAGAYEGCMAVVEVFDSSTYRVGWDPLAASSTTWRRNP